MLGKLLGVVVRLAAAGMARSPALALMLATTAALACSFNTDCAPGSQCVKAQGSIYGVCAGGLLPGNSNDNQPVYSPLDLNGTFGNTCSFDTNCGPGSRCLKSASSIYGVCVRK